MLRKLTLAVLVISLALAFVGTAFADTRTPTATIKSLPAPADRLDNKIQHSGDPAAMSRTLEDTPMGVDMPYPSPYAPDHECELLDLADYDGSFYSWDFYGDYPYMFGNRFPIQAFHDAEVYGFAIRYYDISNNAGGVDLVVNVHEENSGEPGTIIYTETIPAATLLAAGPGHWLFSFASPVHVTGDSYYITYAAVGDASDYISIGTNMNADGTDNGAGVAYVGGWMTLSDAFGNPRNLRLSSDVCYTDYSSCYYTEPAAAQYFQEIPVVGNIDGVWNGWGQRFEVANDTLKDVHLVFYIHHDNVNYYAGTNETNGVIVEIWPDDGSGNIDASGSPLASRTIPGGLANMFPVTGEDRNVNWIEEHVLDFSAENLVMRGFFHVTARMTSDDPADGQVLLLIEDFGLGGSVNYSGAPWDMCYSSPSWLDFWWNEAAFVMGATLCKDEFEECETQILHAGPFANAFGTGGNVWKVAQQVAGSSAGNRVEAIRFQVADETPWGGGAEDNGDPQLAVNIWTQTVNVDGDFVPGTLVYADTIGEPVYYPGWNEVVIPDVMLFGEFWVGYEMLAEVDTPSVSWFNTCMDLGPFDVNSGAWLFYEPWGEWIHTNLFSGIDFNNWIIDVDFCMVPVPERECNNLDWSTLQSDFARTGASGVGIGNAACNLTYNWEYEHPSLFGQYVGPVIYDGKLVTTWRSTGTGSEYRVYDLYSKDLLYTIPVDGAVNAIPTAAHIAYNDKDMLFITGGDELVAAGYDLDAGTMIWEIHAGDLPGMGTGETNATGNFIIDGNGILYFTTNVGKVYCVWADDGLQWGGIWPVDYYQIASPGPTTNRTGAFDGENLYYGYSTILGGDIASVSSADGSENWTLTSADGLKAFETWGPGATVEQFAGGVSVDVEEGYLYAVSTLASAVYPQTAVFYKINTSTGVAEEYEQCNGFNWMCTPVIGLNHVYVQFSPPGTYWVQQVNAANVQAFRKDNGDYDWGTIFGADNSSDPVAAEMVLTCEPEGAHDLLFVFAGEGGLHCIDVDEGVEIFNRHIADTIFGGSAGAIGYDTSGEVHLVFETVLGRVIDLTAQEDRPRLELQNGEFRSPVPFGTDDPYVVTFEEVYANTGCTDLEVEITLSDVTNGAPGLPVSMIRPGLEADAAALADQLTPGKDFARTADLSGEAVSKDQVERKLVNPASTALYAWIKTPVLTHTVAPGDLQDIDVEVVQGDVGRGVFYVYAQFDSNDPDYWLDQLASPPVPECHLVFVGGCITEQTYMEFGAGLVNKQDVYNSGRLADGGTEGPTFGGSAGVLFQGMYSMAVSTHRLAFNVHSWITGSTDEWHAWLPDPYNGSCVPYLDAGVQLGAYTEDGSSYTPIMGNAVMYNSIDSVMNFDDGSGTYDWTNFDAPYDNDSTMGLYIVHRTIGAYDFGTNLDLLGNASVEIFNITERNGRALPGWKMGNYLDYDVGSVDTAWLDQSISAGMVFGESPGVAQDMHGMIKIPFGCGEDPLINAWSVDQDSGMFGDGEDGYFDVAYDMMSAAPGEYNHGNNMSQVANDQAASFTIAAHDFEPNETIEFAVANYWVYDTPGNHTELARLANQLNKWMGFGRGDVNNDDAINLADIIWIANYVNYSGPGPIPFEHLGDVDADGDTDNADAQYLLAYYFNCGPCPLGEMLNK